MSLAFFILFVITLLGFITYLWGRSLPATQEVKIQRNIQAPLQKVWAALVNWSEQVSWRRKLDRVEVINSDYFIEYPNRGRPIKFRVVDSQPPNRIELGLSGPFIGTYIAELTEENGITTIAAYEKISIDSTLGRVLSRLFFNLEDFANHYLDELAAYVEKV